MEGSRTDDQSDCQEGEVHESGDGVKEGEVEMAGSREVDEVETSPVGKSHEVGTEEEQFLEEVVVTSDSVLGRLVMLSR